MRSRTATAAVGLLASVALSAVLYVVFDTLLVFLVVPFVPVLFRGLGADERPNRPPARTCPTCSFRTRDPAYEYCPRDGRRLNEEPDERG